MQGLTIDDSRGAFQGRADPFVQFPVYGLPASPVELVVMCRHDHGQICDYYETKQRMMSTTENIPGVVKTRQTKRVIPWSLWWSLRRRIPPRSGLVQRATPNVRLM